MSEVGPPSVSELVQWLEGQLSPEESGQIEERVAGADERTRRTVEWLRSFIDDARGFPLHEPPPYVRQRLAQHFEAWAAARAALDRAKPEDVETHLVFDSRVDLALAGVRGSGVEDEAFHVAYTSEVADLVLDVVGVGDRFRIEGQVLVADHTTAPIFSASASGPSSLVRTVDGDTAGRFQLDDVPPGPTVVRAENGLVRLVAAIHLPARS